MNPQRIMAFPYTAYIAPQGTVFPTLSTTEAEIVSGNEGGSGGKKYGNMLTSGAEIPWFRLGTSGNRDYGDAGVTVTHQQTVGTFQGAGSTMPRKTWRSDEGMLLAFDLADMSPEQYAKILDEAKVEKPTSGEEWFSLFRGLEITGQAMFLRGRSSVTEGKVSQYEIPYCFQSGNPAPKFAIKGGPALLALQFTVLEGELSTVAKPLDGLPRLRVQK